MPEYFVAPPTYYWGVDSAASALDKVHKATRFEQVTKYAGQAPAFWGRYIGGNYALTTKEAEFLHERDCKVLIIYNGAHDNAASVRGSLKEGEKDATRAVVAAELLEVPSGVWIYVDVEWGWQPSSEWIKGWAETMYDSEYWGGFYFPPNPGFTTPYCEAYKDNPKMADGLLFCSGPEKNSWKGPATKAPGFAPSQASCNGKSVIWQYAESWAYAFGDEIDEDLASADGYSTMW